MLGEGNRRSLPKFQSIWMDIFGSTSFLIFINIWQFSLLTVLEGFPGELPRPVVCDTAPGLQALQGLPGHLGVHHAALCNTMQHYAALCSRANSKTTNLVNCLSLLWSINAVSNSTLLYYTVLYCTVLYCTVLYCTVLYCTVSYHAIPYHSVMYCTSPYSSMVYDTVLHYTVLYCTL